MRIVVLMGGKSYEREISLKTGRVVANALRELGHEVFEMDISPNIGCELISIKPDKVFIALHGPYGEDGRVQGLLDILGIPYVGSGVLASALAMDKEVTKRLLASEGIPTPPWTCVFKGKPIPNWELFPAVVKPADQGSSVGLKVVHRSEDMEDSLKELFKLTDKVLIESFIEGRDMTVALLKGKPMPPIEIRPSKEVYDYESKYTQGKSRYLFPEGDIVERLEAIAVKVHELLGLKDMARVDFRVSGDGEPYVLEVNTVPGMTELSLFPMACKKAGISFKDMLSIILS